MAFLAVSPPFDPDLSVPYPSEVSYLLCHGGLPAVDVVEDVALSLINLQQVDAMGCGDCGDNGVFVHKKLGGNVTG